MVEIFEALAAITTIIADGVGIAKDLYVMNEKEKEQSNLKKKFKNIRCDIKKGTKLTVEEIKNVEMKQDVFLNQFNNFGGRL